MINQVTITEFQEAIKEEYGKDISLEEAESILNGLVGYFDVLAKINHDIASN